MSMHWPSRAHRGMRVRLGGRARRVRQRARRDCDRARAWPPAPVTTARLVLREPPDVGHRDQQRQEEGCRGLG